MQKRELAPQPIRVAATAAAVLCVSTAAYGQPSDVTVYGILDTAIRHTSNVDGNHHSKNELVSSGLAGSRLGIRGQEDLGGGLKAIFTLEHGIRADTGESAYSQFWGRQTFVGLSGNWGTLSFGRQYNALNNVGWAFNPLDQGWGIFWSDPLYVGGDVFFEGYRIDNSLVYRNDFGPVSVQLDYGFGERAGSRSRGSTVGAGALYRSGPLALGVAYDKRRGAVSGADSDTYVLGGSYAFGDAAVYAGHMRHRERPASARQTISFVGLGYQLTPTMHLSGAYYRYRQNAAVTTQYAATPILLGRGTADALAVVVDYALGKRTSLYLEADAVRARKGAVGRETEYWGGAPVLGVGRSSREGVMFGIRHMF